MKPFGTFLIATTILTGAAIFGAGRSTTGLEAVYASSTDAQPVVVTTNSEDSGKKTTSYYATPKLVLTGRDIEGDTVMAGDQFEMTIHFKNESTSTKLRNISIKLSNEENQIVTASGSDTIYIDSLDKEAECDVTVQMKSKEDLEQKNYTVNVDYKYEDNSKNSFEDSASITVPVKQEARLGISEVKLSKSELTIDGKTSLSFKVNNMGLDKLRNVSVDFSGDTIKEVTYFVGTIEPGQSGAVDMTINPDNVGTDDIHINVTFEDTAGGVSTYDDSVALTVNDVQPETVKEEKEENNNLPIILCGAVVLLIIIIIIAKIVKKKNREKYE